MSNGALEFLAFRDLEAQDASIDPHVMLVNAAESGQDAETIKDSSAPYWSFVAGQLSKAQVTGAQVQIVWLKEAIKNESEAFPIDADRSTRSRSPTKADSP
jgi:hypothetical protein